MGGEEEAIEGAMHSQRESVDREKRYDEPIPSIAAQPHDP